MTLLRKASYGIIEKLIEAGIDTRLIILTASHRTIRERILSRGEDENYWCIENIELARTGSAALPGIHIETDGISLDRLCDLVLAKLEPDDN